MTDEISASTNREGVRIASTAGDTDTTLADFYREGSSAITQTSFSVIAAAVGFFSDGTDQLDFDLNQTLSSSQDSGMFLAGENTLSAGDVKLGLTVSAELLPTTMDREDLQAQYTVTVNDGPNTAVIDYIRTSPVRRESGGLGFFFWHGVSPCSGKAPAGQIPAVF